MSGHGKVGIWGTARTQGLELYPILSCFISSRFSPSERGRKALGLGTWIHSFRGKVLQEPQNGPIPIKLD